MSEPDIDAPDMHLNVSNPWAETTEWDDPWDCDWHDYDGPEALGRAAQQRPRLAATSIHGTGGGTNLDVV